MVNQPTPNVNTGNKDRVSDMDADKTKTPDKSRDENKVNPDSTKTKGDSCGC